MEQYGWVIGFVVVGALVYFVFIRNKKRTTAKSKRTEDGPSVKPK